MNPPATMTAAVAEAAGAPLRLIQLPCPVPAAGQVLVRIAASGVNPLDTKIHAGQAVLVHGGAGGVGHVAIQIARAFGAEVFATGSADNAATIQRLGATPIDYRASTVEAYVAEHTQGQGFDLVYDTVGGATLDASFAAVRRFGHVVSCLGWGTHALAPLSFRAATYSGVFTLLPLLTGEGRAHHGEILREAARLVDAGRLAPIVDARRFTLATAGEAHAAVASGKASGKLVVDIA